MSPQLSTTQKQFSPNPAASEANPYQLYIKCLPALVLLMAICMSTETRGVKIDPAQLEQIKIGQTSQAEVMSLLGKPSRLRKSQGQTEMNYSQQLECRETGGYESWHGETGQEVAELLPANGADVNAKENKGRTPLRIVVEAKHSKVEAILRAYVAKE